MQPPSESTSTPQNNPSRQPTPNTNDDATRQREFFRFFTHAWDITEALKLIEHGEGRTTRIAVSDWARLLGLIAIDPNHADTVDLDQPVILVAIPQNGGPITGPMIIDGWHRLYRADREGQSYLDAVYLDETIEPRIRLVTPVWNDNTGPVTYS